MLEINLLLKNGTKIYVTVNNPLVVIVVPSVISFTSHCYNKSLKNRDVKVTNKILMANSWFVLVWKYMTWIHAGHGMDEVWAGRSNCIVLYHLLVLGTHSKVTGGAKPLGAKPYCDYWKLIWDRWSSLDTDNNPRVIGVWICNIPIGLTYFR